MVKKVVLSCFCIGKSFGWSGVNLLLIDEQFKMSDVANDIPLTVHEISSA